MTDRIVSKRLFSIRYKTSFLENLAKKRSILYRDITLSGDLIIIACVSIHGYISVISQYGKELYRIGTGSVRSPYGLCASFDFIYVTDIYFHTLGKYSLNGRLIARIGKQGGNNGEFDLPYGLTVDNTGNILYVTDNRNHRIQVFTSDLEFITSFGTNIFNRVSDVKSCVDGSIVVLDNSGRRLHKLSPDFYQVRTVHTHIPPVNLITLYYPLFFCVDTSDNIFISDRYSFCIQVFDSNLVHLSSFIGNVLSDKMKLDPKGIVCDDNGVIMCLSDSGPFIRIFKAS
ncbi:NHL repeat containing protein [Oopsacas minuta]|uniref:NHL repeat containing protein n=1 Tax=Oopsacas minuta TaxID=111878 RepID=A0AAV7JPF7_9METZ|nr:NHL repeat containing protein [Oopsacas minuta]